MARALHDGGHVANRARKRAAYLAVVVGGLSRRQVARAMGRDHAVVVRACEEMEAWRERSEVEMARLERDFEKLLRRYGLSDGA